MPVSDKPKSHGFNTSNVEVHRGNVCKLAKPLPGFNTSNVEVHRRLSQWTRLIFLSFNTSNVEVHHYYCQKQDNHLILFQYIQC